MINIDLSTAYSLAKRAVAERGSDFIYKKEKGNNRCSYFHTGGKPGCIVGLILSYLGLSPADLNERQNGVSVTTLNIQGVVHLDSASLFFFHHLQGRQDDGSEWGFALASAVSATTTVFPIEMTAALTAYEQEQTIVRPQIAEIQMDAAQACTAFAGLLEEINGVEAIMAADPKPQPKEEEEVEEPKEAPKDLVCV